MRRGFTIIELLVVIGIIGILMGIVVTAAGSTTQSARSTRARALFKMVETGLATYHAQKGEWPVDFSGTRSNNEGVMNSNDPTKIILTASEVRTCVQSLVNETKTGNPLIDVSGLWVSLKPGDPMNVNAIGSLPSGGMDFMTAVRGSSDSRKKHRTNELYYGYADPPTGKFLRFKMTYSIPSDTISVSGWRGES